MAEKIKCSVCDSSRQRNLIFIYEKLGKRFGSFKPLPVIKYNDVQCIRCVIFSYARYRSQWFDRHLKAWVVPFSRYFDQDQKIKVNAFREKNETKAVFPLEEYL